MLWPALHELPRCVFASTVFDPPLFQEPDLEFASEWPDLEFASEWPDLGFTSEWQQPMNAGMETKRPAPRLAGRDLTESKMTVCVRRMSVLYLNFLRRTNLSNHTLTNAFGVESMRAPMQVPYARFHGGVEERPTPTLAWWATPDWDGPAETLWTGLGSWGHHLHQDCAQFLADVGAVCAGEVPLKWRRAQ